MNQNTNINDIGELALLKFTDENRTLLAQAIMGKADTGSVAALAEYYHGHPQAFLVDAEDNWEEVEELLPQPICLSMSFNAENKNAHYA